MGVFNFIINKEVTELEASELASFIEDKYSLYFYLVIDEMASALIHFVK